MHFFMAVSQRLRLYNFCLFRLSEPYNPPQADALITKTVSSCFSRLAQSNRVNYAFNKEI